MASVDSSSASKSWELSLYELHRAPQEVITDNTEIAVSPRSLHSELMCPICLDMLKNTMTTKECLHRFCSDCIITALRSGNKECPTCRKKLVSKRSLRPDPNFDMLIAKIYPSRDEYEAHQERVLANLSKTHNQSALLNSIEEGIKVQSQNRGVRIKKNAPENEANSNTTPTASAPSTPTPSESGPSTKKKSKSSSSTNLSENESNGSGAEGPSDAAADKSCDDQSGPSCSSQSHNEIELVFKPHPVEMGSDNELIKALKENAVRYIKTTSNATGNNRKFVSFTKSHQYESFAIVFQWTT